MACIDTLFFATAAAILAVIYPVVKGAAAYNRVVERLAFGRELPSPRMPASHGRRQNSR